MCDVSVDVIVRRSGCCLVCDVSMLSLSDTVVVFLCVMSLLMSLSDAVVVVLYVTSLCCHCQTQWLLSCM